MGIVLQNSCHNSPKIGFVSLGCPKATVDAEKMLTALKQDGYELVNQYDTADLVIVNTCGFIDAAVEESLNAIGEALTANGRVIVTGCLGAKATSDGDNFVLQTHPKVLAVTGPNQLGLVLDAVHQHLPIPANQAAENITSTPIQLTPRHYAYLKISEGCNQRCTFCIIPSMRGDLVSHPLSEILDEAKKLFDSGVKELLVVSQDTGAYGVDLKNKIDFWQGRPIKTRIVTLAEELGHLAQQFGAWVRLHYLYPYPHLDDLIPLMADRLILPYLDMPLQHANPEILKLMRRPGNIEKQLQQLNHWRSLCPDLVIRSTFIVGFPGETDSHFNDLLGFLSEAKLNRVGAFAYSPVDGAAANQLPNPVPESIKQERLALLMKHANEISTTLMQRKIGQKVKVIVDKVNGQTGIGRTMGDAPEIDGLAYIQPYQKASSRYRVGEIITAKILDVRGPDWIVAVV